MEQEHLSSQCDQETFERVWRRVMPESRPDCPIVLPAEPAASPAVREAPPALPAVAASAPPDRPVAGEEHNVPCLGAASAIYGGQLQQFVDRTLADWRSYQALSRRAQGNSGRILSAIAADQRRHAKRLSTAYFLISGVRYWPADRPAAHRFWGCCSFFLFREKICSFFSFRKRKERTKEKKPYREGK